MAVASRRSLAVQRVPIHPRRVSREFESFLTDPALRGLWHPKYYLPGSSHIPDLSGRGHHARFGSSGGTDTNDPFVALNTNKVQYLYMSGTAGNFLSANSVENLQVTGDIDLRVAVALADWTPTGGQVLIGKYGGSGSRNYLFQVLANGKLRLLWSVNGSLDNTADSTVAPTVADGALLLVRGTLDVDDGAGNHVVRFYTKRSTPADAAADLAVDTGWMQLGDPVTFAGTTSIFASNRIVEIGSINTGVSLRLIGKVYAINIKRGINGTTLGSPNFTDRSKVKEPFQTFTDAQGNVWTFAYSESQSGGRRMFVVNRPWMSYDGVDDYHQVEDHSDVNINIGDDFTLLALIRGQPGTNTNDSRAIFKRSGSGGRGWRLSVIEGPRRVFFMVADDGSSSIPEIDGSFTGESRVVIGEFTAADQRARLYDVERGLVAVGSGSLTGVGSPDNTLPLRFGAASNTLNSAHNGLIGGVAILKRILSADEKRDWANLLRNM